MFHFIGLELKPPPAGKLSRGPGLERFDFTSQDPRRKTVLLWLDSGKGMREFIARLRTKHADALKTEIFAFVCVLVDT